MKTPKKAVKKKAAPVGAHPGTARLIGSGKVDGKVFVYVDDIHGEMITYRLYDDGTMSRVESDGADE